LVAVSQILPEGGILAPGISSLIFPLWHWNPGSWQLYLCIFLFGIGILTAGSCIFNFFFRKLNLGCWQMYL
jgi:hypothetical protein